MNWRRKALCALIAVTVCLAYVPTVWADQVVRVFFNGNEIRYDVSPQIISERAMVPIRFTIEAIVGETMGWDAATQTLSYRANGHYITHRIGEKFVYVDSVPVEFPTPSIIIDSRALVPIRMIAETSGCEVAWDAANYYIIITRPGAHLPSPMPVVTINSAVADKTAVNTGEAVLVTVKTNANAQNVWIHYDSGDTNANFHSSDAHGIKTWSVTCHPSRTQTMTVYANTSHSVTGAVTRNLDVSVNSADARIISLNANETTVNSGDEVVLTVRTNSAASYVWADTGANTYNFRRRSTDNSGNQTWDMTFYPRTTVNAIVYASARSSNGTEASDNIRITVRGSESEYPVISFTSVNPGNVLDDGSERINNFTITTNKAVTYVYIVDNQGKYHEADFKPDSSGSSLEWYVNGVRLKKLSGSGSDSFDVVVYAENDVGNRVNKAVPIKIMPSPKN